MNSGLGSIRGARMAEMSYSPRAQHPAAAPDRPDGLALWPDAADELGRRARPRRPGHGRRDQRAGRGRAVRLRLRPWRRRRRLREHLGHRQALFRRDEGQEHPHPQPPGLQFRGPRHPRHGRGRTQQLLRGRRARRHDRRGRHQRARDPDQLLPEPLGPEPARHVAWTRRRQQLAGRAARSRPGSSSSIRAGPSRSTPARSRPARTTSCTSRSTPAPTSRCSTPAHLHRREGLGRQGVHRRLDQRLRQGAGGQQDDARGGGEDHRPHAPTRSARRPNGSPSRRTASAAADDVRLREGPDLGQRQLPHQRGAGEHGARHRQYRPPGRRLRPHGRPPGRLCAPVRRACRPAGGLRRPAADRAARAASITSGPATTTRRRSTPSSSSASTRSAPTW